MQFGLAATSSVWFQEIFFDGFVVFGLSLSEGGWRRVGFEGL